MDTPYKFPDPGDEGYWQKLVWEAVEGKTLKWQNVNDTQWVLIGACPRCHDPMSQVFQLGGGGVIISGPLYSTSLLMDTVDEEARPKTQDKPPSPTFRDELVCQCETEHKKGVEGCGYGRGLIIEIPGPGKV